MLKVNTDLDHIEEARTFKFPGLDLDSKLKCDARVQYHFIKFSFEEPATLELCVLTLTRLR